MVGIGLGHLCTPGPALFFQPCESLFRLGVFGQFGQDLAIDRDGLCHVAGFGGGLCPIKRLFDGAAHVVLPQVGCSLGFTYAPAPVQWFREVAGSAGWLI